MSKERDQAKHHLDMKKNARGQTIAGKLASWGDVDEQLTIFDALGEPEPSPVPKPSRRRETRWQA